MSIILTKKRILIKSIIFPAIISLLFALIPSGVDAVYGIDPSIRQVKTPSSSAVYYLDHRLGLKKAYINANSYLAYGNKWSDIKVIQDSDLALWSDLKYIKNRETGDIFEIAGPTKLLIDEQKKATLNLEQDLIPALHPVDFQSYTDVTILPVIQTDVITIKSLSNTSSNIPYNTKGNIIASFSFDPVKDTEIESIKIHLDGIFNTSLINNIYLEDANGLLLGTNMTGTRKDMVFNFYPQALRLQAGEEKQINLKVGINQCENCTSNTIGASITQSSDIKSSSEIVGEFPLVSNLRKVVKADDNIAAIRVAEQSIRPITTALMGESSTKLAQFIITETSGNDNVLIEKIIIKNNGSLLSTSLKNILLKDSNNRVISRAPELKSDSSAILLLNNYKINQSKYKVFSIEADVVNGVGKTIDFDITHVDAVGDEYEFGISPVNTILTELVKVVKDDISVLSKPLLSSQSVFAEQKGIIIGAFEIKAKNNNLKMDSLEFALIKNSSAPTPNSLIHIVNTQTGEVFGSANLGAFSPNSIFVIPMGNEELKANKTLKLSLIADIPATANTGDAYKTVLRKVKYLEENGATYTDAVEVSGEVLKIDKTSLYSFKNSAYEGIQYTKGQKGAQVASYYLEAPYGDDILINGVTLSQDNTSGFIDSSKGFSNLRLYFGSRLCTNISKPSGGKHVFERCKYLLKSGKRVELKVYVDTETDLLVEQTNLSLTGIIANSNSSSFPASINGLPINSYTSIFKNPNVNLEIKSGGTVNPGSQKNPVASFTVKNTTGEDVYLKSISLTDPSGKGFSTSEGFSNLKIVTGERGSRVASISRPVARTNKLSLNSKIKIDEEVTFDIIVDANDETQLGSFDLFISDAIVIGKTSKVQMVINSLPSEKVIVSVE